MGHKILHLQKGAKVSVKDNNISLQFYDGNSTIVHIKDIDFVLFDTNDFSITAKAISLLSKNNTAVLFIDDVFTPSSILLPYYTHSLANEVAKIQIQISQEYKSIIWQKIIISKVYNQYTVLKYIGSTTATKLEEYIQQILPNDKANVEAKSAKVYWKALFGKTNFKREQNSLDIQNQMLNYGYAILRSTIARSVSANGLLPSFGIWHDNRYNAFNLVDDLIEPFRPVCDMYIKHLLSIYGDEDTITPKIKQEIIKLLMLEIIDINKGSSTISTAIDIYVLSYKKSIQTEDTNMLILPTINTKKFDELL